MSILAFQSNAKHDSTEVTLPVNAYSTNFTTIPEDAIPGPNTDQSGRGSIASDVIRATFSSRSFFDWSFRAARHRVHGGDWKMIVMEALH